MLIKNFKKFILVSVLIFNSSAHAADDVAEMAGISHQLEQQLVQQFHNYQVMQDWYLQILLHQ